MELANLGISRDRGLDGTSRDGKRLDGPSSGEGDPGVRMGAANSNGSPMFSSADSRWRSGSTDSRGRSGSAELDGTSSEDGELDVTSGDKGELDGTSGELGVSLLRAGTGGRSGLESAAADQIPARDRRLSRHWMIASFQSRLPVSGSSIGWWYVIPIRKSVWRTSPSTGECEWYECPCVGEWVVARLSHGDEHDVFVHFAGLFICHGRVAGRTRETRGKVNKVILITEHRIHHYVDE